MVNKQTTVTLFFILTSICNNAQNNFLSFDHSSFVLKQKSENDFPTALYTNDLRFNVTYLGGSYQFEYGINNAFGMGLGLTKIHYEKQWLGTFPGNNKFGIAILKAKFQYISIPLSLTLVDGLVTTHYNVRRRKLLCGFVIAYTPSFLKEHSSSLITYGGADSSSKVSSYNFAPRKFQHSFSIGLCVHRFLFNRNLRLAIEPTAGFGSRYMTAKGNPITFSYGIKFQLSLRIPAIRLVKSVNPGNAEEKRKILEQKQKEITDQLNKQP